MRNFLLVLTALFMLPLTACAAEYEAGVQYEVLPGAATKSPEVVEFFSFFCPHCERFETIAEGLEKGVKGAKFTKAHVEFLPNRQPKLGQLWLAVG